MQSDTVETSSSKKLIWTGRVLSALPVLMMLMGFVSALVNPQMMKDGMKEMGYPPTQAMGIVILEMCCLILYIIPQTAVLGAILLTAYMGGATATHVRIGDPKFVVPVIVGIVVWLGLLLRDRRLRELLPFRR